MSAYPASVYDRPLPAFSDPDAYRFHNPAAIRFAVARFVVQMLAGKAIWAMVSVFAPRACRNDRTAADFAIEALCTGVVAMIAR